MSENPFVVYLKRRLPLVESALGNAAAAPLAHANEPARDLERYLYAPLAAFTEGGGKRVRPVLCLLGGIVLLSYNENKVLSVIGVLK